MVLGVILSLFLGTQTVTNTKYKLHTRLHVAGNCEVFPNDSINNFATMRPVSDNFTEIRCLIPWLKVNAIYSL